MSSRLYLCLLSKLSWETFGSAKHFNTINLSESVPRSLCLTRCSFSLRQSGYSGHSSTLVWLLSFSPGHWNKARPTLKQPWKLFFFFFVFYEFSSHPGNRRNPSANGTGAALLIVTVLIFFDKDRTENNNALRLKLCVCVFSQFSRAQGEKETMTFHQWESKNLQEWWNGGAKFPPTGPTKKKKN